MQGGDGQRRESANGRGAERTDGALGAEWTGQTVFAALARAFAQAALGKVSSINHDSCYHELHHLSNTIIVLEFSKNGVFVRKILQREENKGVELTVCRGNGLRDD